MLLAALTALFMGLGFTLGGPRGAVLALIAAAAMNLVTYWNADRIVLAMHNAKEVTASDCPQLVGIVHDLAARAGLPNPRVYLDRFAPSQRLRHRPRPGPCRRRRDHRPARPPQPRRRWRR